MPGRRAVLTGAGLISPIGNDLSAFWNSLVLGRSGVSLLPSLEHLDVPVRIAGWVREFDPKKYLDKKDRKRLGVMVRTMHFATAGAQMAVEEAGLDKEKLDPTRFGVVFGTATLPSELNDLGRAAQVSVNGHPGRVDVPTWGEKGIDLIPPMWMLAHIPNMVAAHVTMIHNCQGPNNTITQSEIGGLLALTEAMRHLTNDRADVFLIGSADTLLTPINYVRNSKFSGTSLRNDAPAKACRPFDLHRDGRVLGEGGAVLTLESLETARARGAKIYGELVSYGAAFDRGRSGEGIARAIRLALDRAKLQPEDIDHVNAHGASTIPADAWEARGIHAIFGDRVPVLAVKSYFGHLGAASGLVELTASLLAMSKGERPGTLNYETPDPACPVRVPTKVEAIRTPYFLKISLTEMGQVAVLVFRGPTL